MYKSQSNPQSPKSLVLRFMREKRQFSLLFVGKKTGIKPKNIDHMENERRAITDKDILLFLECYHFSFEIFTEMLNIKPLTKQSTNHYFINLKH